MLAPPPEAPFFFWFPSPVDSQQDSLTFSSSPFLIFISNAPSPIISPQICPLFFVLANASSLTERRSQRVSDLGFLLLLSWFSPKPPLNLLQNKTSIMTVHGMNLLKSQFGRSINSRLCSPECNLVLSGLFCCHWLCLNSPLARSFQTHPSLPSTNAPVIHLSSSLSLLLPSLCSHFSWFFSNYSTPSSSPLSFFFSSFTLLSLS